MKRLFLACVVLLLPAWPALAQSPRLDRLVRLADHLERVDPARFDMGQWGNGTDPRDPYYRGCAGGHATELFAAEGLRLRVRAGGRIALVCGDQEGTMACMLFFGLRQDEATSIFSGYRGPWAEAAFIRDFVGGKAARLAGLGAAAGAVG